MSSPTPSEPSPPSVPPPGQSLYGYGYPPQHFPGQHPGYGDPHGRRPARNGLAITSLVLGILALATCWLALPGIILGILAVIFGGIGLARARTDRVSNKGMAIAGMITGVLAAVVGTVLVIVAVRIASDCQEQFGAVITEEQLQSCIQDSVGG